MTTIEKLLENAFVGKTLASVEFSDYNDTEYYKSIGVEPAILPSKIISIHITTDKDGDFILHLNLENNTQAKLYENEGYVLL